MVESIDEVVKDKSNTHTLEEQSNYYEKQAKKFWDTAGISLTVFGFLCAVFVGVMYNINSSGMTVQDHLTQNGMSSAAVEALKSSCPDCVRSAFINTLIKANAIRIIEVSFLLFLIAVALKSFNSAAHNYTINMQRSNSLRAALQLIEKSHTNEAKDAMMDKAAAAIFSHQPTGFNTKPPANLVQNVMEWGKGQKDGE